MEQKKSLLERYGVPVHHLDFKYINDCKDFREIEKILHILRSGEEGYYPDLTKCAEEKLRELKPQSRLFRLEEQIKGRDALGSQELKPIYDWNFDIKDKDQQLQKLSKQLAKEHTAKLDPDLPPIRKTGRILQEKNDALPAEIPNKCLDLKKSEKSKTTTDYRKWDKYDADEEVLRIDLADERIQEEVERKNRLNAHKCRSPPKIEEILKEEDLKENDKLCKLTDIEKEKLSEEFRLRGNEYFRAKEFDNALTEYTRAIQVFPVKAVAAYNNRALTYFKQQKFYEAIKDCEKCLKLEPNSVKGRLRLAEATYAYGKRRESYQLYVNVLEVDSANAVALKAVTELRKMFEDLPPPNATRLIITDASSKHIVASNNRVATGQEKSETLTKTNTANAAASISKDLTKSYIDYDLADLVKPNRVVKNKFLKAAENFGKMHTKANEQSKVNNERNVNKLGNRTEERSETSDVISALRMPFNIGGKSSTDKKPLIEEI